MFREMRRAHQALPMVEIEAVMERCTHGTLACHGDDGYPYAVALNFVYGNNVIYFHSANAGHKIDAIKANPKVSFTVIDQDQIVSAEYTSYFRSVTAFGRARIVAGEEWTTAFTALVEKYSADQPETIKRQKVAECHTAWVIAIDVEHITGKESKELVEQRRSTANG